MRFVHHSGSSIDESGFFFRHIIFFSNIFIQIVQFDGSRLHCLTYRLPGTKTHSLPAPLFVKLPIQVVVLFLPL